MFSSVVTKLRNFNPYTIAAFIWGISEATFFFIIPDVFISFRSLKGFREGFVASLAAMAGALVGGLLLYLVSLTYGPEILLLYDWLPAISPDMIADVERQLQETGLPAMILGPLTGTPYKLYAAWAALLGFNLALFLAISIPARYFRFFVALVLAWAIGRIFNKRFGEKVVQIGLLCYWVILYTYFFQR